MVTTMQWMKPIPVCNKFGLTSGREPKKKLYQSHQGDTPLFHLIIYYLSQVSFSCIYACSYITHLKITLLSHFRHSGTWVQVLDIMGLDILGLDILGIIHRLTRVFCCEYKEHSAHAPLATTPHPATSLHFVDF